MAKTPLTFDNNKFDLKFFLVGASGAGKTHLLGTYTLGPVHFYMLDRGGEKTLQKLIATRPVDAPPVSADLIPSRSKTYSDFWKILQRDARDGFFEQMAEENGLVVLPDSLTTANIMARNEVAALAGLDLVQMGKANDQKKAMHQALWGQLLGWMQELVGTVQALPCAAATTVHLFTETDKEGAVIRRVPSVNGQFRQLVGIDFDEVYHIKNQGSKHYIHFKEHDYVEAKSRVFACKKLANASMDTLAQAYMSGDTLKDEGGSLKEAPSTISLIKKPSTIN